MYESGRIVATVFLFSLPSVSFTSAGVKKCPCTCWPQASVTCCSFTLLFELFSPTVSETAIRNFQTRGANVASRVRSRQPRCRLLEPSVSSVLCLCVFSPGQGFLLNLALWPAKISTARRITDEELRERQSGLVFASCVSQKVLKRFSIVLGKFFVQIGGSVPYRFWGKNLSVIYTAYGGTCEAKVLISSLLYWTRSERWLPVVCFQLQESLEKFRGSFIHRPAAASCEQEFECIVCCGRDDLCGVWVCASVRLPTRVELTAGAGGGYDRRDYLIQAMPRWR